MLRRLIGWVRAVFRARAVEREMRAEMQFHLDSAVERLVARGLSPEAARAAAQREFGNVAQIEEASRDARGVRWITDAIRDARFGLRSLARSPGWTFAVVSMFALGLGASTAVFSVVDALLVNPVAYPAAGRIALVRRIDSDAQSVLAPSAEYVDLWRQTAKSIEAVEGYARREIAVARGGAAPTIASAALIDTGFLAFTGTRPIVGRGFDAQDVANGGAAVVLLGETYWRRAFGGAAGAIGSTVRVGDRVATVIGILPAALQLPDVNAGAPDIWLPLVRAGDSRLAGVAVRMRPHTSIHVAEAELDSIDARAGIRGSGDGFHFVTRLARPADTLRFKNTLVMLAGAVALLLLVACSNIAHLTLIRSTAREMEFAVRYALGGGRGRIARQLIAECLTLSMIGSAAALGIAALALRVVAEARPASLSALSRVAMNGGVLGLSIVLAVAVGIAVGLLAGGRAMRAGMAHGLRGKSGASPASRRLQTMFVVSEVALSATLLIGAVALVRGIIRLQALDVGFDARRLYAVTVPIPSDASPAATDALRAALLRRGRAIGGIQSATIAGMVPPRVTYLAGVLQPEGRPAIAGSPVIVTADFVASDYFASIGLPLVSGRALGVGASSPNEVVINETLAKQLWPADQPVGRRFRVGDGAAPRPTANEGGASPWLTVVGVARNAEMHGLLDVATAPAMYQTLVAGDGLTNRVTLIVRMTSAERASPVEALRRIGSEVTSDPTRVAVVSVEDALRETIAGPRFITMLLSAFAVAAVLLAMVGLYGVISSMVAQRTREIGIRMTLGATCASITRLVVAHGLAISLVGAGVGLAGGIAGTRLVQHAVPGVAAAGVASLAVGAALLLIVSVLACIVPTIRAASVDPVITIRAE